MKTPQLPFEFSAFKFSACKFLPTALLAVCVGCGTPTTSTGSETDSDSETTTGDMTETDGETGSDSDTGLPEPSELDGFNRFVLRVDDTPPPPLTLVMDHQDAIDFFGAQAKDLKLVDIDPTPMLENALLAIQGACGDKWTLDNKNPNHNCQVTDLGKTFGANWQHTPEYSMVRLLSMTPSNADMRGTAFEKLEDVMNSDLIVEDFAWALTQILEIERTDPLLPMGALVAAVKDTLLQHPAVNEDGTLGVTLDDALKDMRPLAAKFGPVEDHPGILLPDDVDNPNGFETKSDAIDHQKFQMKVVAGSNLRFVDGVDLSGGGGDMFLLRDDAENVLELKFTGAHEANLEISGINDPPTMDMRMRINEFIGDAEPCLDPVEGCQTNQPSEVYEGAPETNVWRLPLWSMERLVGQSGYRAYKDDPEDFSKDISKDICLFMGQNNCYIRLKLGADGAPEGWMKMELDNLFNEEEFPEPQFFWEMFVDIAEISFHDVDPDTPGQEVEEGATPTFALTKLNIGLTADDLIAQIRQSLEDQEDVMSDLILGRYWKNNHALDFYYRRADDGNLYLFFANNEDLRPDPQNPNAPLEPAYQNPGFFSCVEVNEGCKESRLNISGVSDTTHEKLALKRGWNNLYMQDDLNGIYEVRIYVPENRDATKIWAYVRSAGA